MSPSANRQFASFSVFVHASRPRASGCCAQSHATAQKGESLRANRRADRRVTPLLRAPLPGGTRSADEGGTLRSLTPEMKAQVIERNAKNMNTTEKSLKPNPPRRLLANAHEGKSVFQP